MPKWWSWWIKWWVWAGAGIFIVMLFSRPPQLWFWFVIFMVIILYGLERSLNLIAQYRDVAKNSKQDNKSS